MHHPSLSQSGRRRRGRTDGGEERLSEVPKERGRSLIKNTAGVQFKEGNGRVRVSGTEGEGTRDDVCTQLCIQPRSTSLPRSHPSFPSRASHPRALEAGGGGGDGKDRSRSLSPLPCPSLCGTRAQRIVPGEFNEIRNSVHLNFPMHVSPSPLSSCQKFVQAKEWSGTRNKIDFS